jgi:Fur family ferric uptake transcriptional regulator
MPHCQTIIKELRQKGYRLTPQREMIIEIIAHTEGHLAAEDIFARVQEQTQAVNLATIYRTLDTLVEERLACKTDLGSGKVVYATTHHGPHLHLVCRQCGQVIEADYEMIAPLASQLAQRYGFNPALNHISIFGFCSDCQKGEHLS